MMVTVLSRSPKCLPIVFAQIKNYKVNENLNILEKIIRNWNVNEVPVSVIPRDITQ